MCTGKCSKCIGRLLLPLGLCAIIANILLYFPNGEVLDAAKITDFVWYFHGILGAGLIVYLPAFLMLGAGGDGCCANRCGMLLSMLLSAMGFFGAVYCMIMSSLGLEQGPLCDTGDGDYVYPFRNQTLELMSREGIVRIHSAVMDTLSTDSTKELFFIVFISLAVFL
ncbi:transmembrane 4 L6 family member 1-like isoform X3 [Acipenser ruthenus]|uniref:transmembrane 4 L6 family member 1-like isoform X3 n=1 Tax=Acipenser ruthenus TaxID=7906 RepID=UPI0015615988|nr:transmembrane 4 L6 family member 1-like isoform X3 [Acipenser ruthenus]